jgi:hypothetical protein
LTPVWHSRWLAGAHDDATERRAQAIGEALPWTVILKA